MLSPKGNRDAQKIFVIGHPRNGTTTLHKLFEANGLDSFHSSRDWPTARHDAFTDFGQMRPVAAYDKTYGNAKFILNYRPSRDYLISIASHHGKIYSVQNFVNEIWRRSDYFAWVLRHFQGRRDFMAINIEHPSFPSAVADFCELDVKSPIDGTVFNASIRDKAPENLRNIEKALALLDLTDEAGRGCLVSHLHGRECEALLALRETIFVLE